VQFEFLPRAPFYIDTPYLYASAYDWKALLTLVITVIASDLTWCTQLHVHKID
jgi:hypothetical protein